MFFKIPSAQAEVRRKRSAYRLWCGRVPETEDDGCGHIILGNGTGAPSPGVHSGGEEIKSEISQRGMMTIFYKNKSTLACVYVTRPIPAQAG